ncbi:unnamed protein product [Amoebophrya sp. A120]|nr:unnamed protein product [Amoebophrya sp. A120]|eukprot:GSA120T00010419001.1
MAQFCFFAWDPTAKASPEEIAHLQDDEKEFAHQDAKILYYHPGLVTQEEKRNQVSLVQGLVDFTRQWDMMTDAPAKEPKTKTVSTASPAGSKTTAPAGAAAAGTSGSGGSSSSSSRIKKQKKKRCSSLRSMKTKDYSFGFEEVEDNIWFALAVKHPAVTVGSKTVTVPGGNKQSPRTRGDHDGLGGPPDGQKGEDNSSSRPNHRQQVIDIRESLETIIPENTLLAVLKNLYSIFQLLHGKVRHFLPEGDNKGQGTSTSASSSSKEDGKKIAPGIKMSSHSMKTRSQQRELLADLLEDLVPAYLETLTHHLLDSQLANGVFYQLDGFHYGPVERNTYVSIATFLAKLKEMLGVEYRNCALFYKAHLIYSGMDLEDMKVAYSYLVNLFNGQVSNEKLNQPPYGRIPTSNNSHSSAFGRSHLIEAAEGASTNSAANLIETTLFGGAATVLPSARSGTGAAGRKKSAQPHNSGCYLFGSDDTSSTATSNRNLFIPRVFLPSNNAEGQLVALCYHGVLLLLVFDKNVNVDARLLEAIKKYSTSPELCENLSTLVPIIEKQFSLVMSAEDEYRFLYFNHANQALRVSNHFSTGHSSQSRNVFSAAFGGGSTSGNTLLGGGGAGSGTNAHQGNKNGALTLSGKKKNKEQAASAQSRVYNLVASVITGGGTSTSNTAGGNNNGNSSPGDGNADGSGAGGKDDDKENGRLTVSQVNTPNTMEYLQNGDKDLYLAQCLHSTIAKNSDCNYREVCLKEHERGWICAKRSLEREFYLMLDQPSMMLSKCQEESARFSAIHFSNIYMM